MKKFILLFAVLCIGAQAHAGLLPKARIGFKAGWNYQANNLKGAQDFDFNSDSAGMPACRANLRGECSAYAPNWYTRTTSLT